MTARSRHTLCGLLLVTSGILPVWAQAPAPRDQSSEACPGTLASVREVCGCEPREEAVFNVLSQTKLNTDNLRSQVKHCFNLDGKLDIKKFKLNGDAALNGCLSSMEDQFPEYRETLTELVRAAKDVPASKRDVWLCCYAGKLGQNLQGCKSVGKPAPSPGPVKAGGRSGSGRTTAVTSSPGIHQQVKAHDGRVKAGDIEASHEGKSGPANIQQSVEASGHGVTEVGDIKAHVGRGDD